MVTIQRGDKCNDGGGSTPCNTGGGGTPCIHPSCGKVLFTSSNWDYNPMTCTFIDSVDGAYLTRQIATNRTVQPGPYYGYPDRTLRVECDGVKSNTYDWPNN